MTRPKNTMQEKVLFSLHHVALTASELIPMMKATRKCRVTDVNYKNPAGLAEDATNAFAGSLLKLPGAALAFSSAFTTTHGTETINIATHGLQTGDGPLRMTNVGGALPAGYLTATDYYAIRTGTGTLQVALTRALAYAGTAVAISGDGTGTHTLASVASTTRPVTVATIFDTDSDEAGTNTLAADAWVSGIIASAPACVLERGEELAFLFVEDGSSTLPAGHLHGEATYL